MKIKLSYKRAIVILAIISILLAVAITIIGYRITGKNSALLKAKEYRIIPTVEPGFYPNDIAVLLDIYDKSGNNLVKDGNIEILYTITSHSARTPAKNELIAPTGEKYMFSGGKIPSYDSMQNESFRKTYKYTGYIILENSSTILPRVIELRAIITCDGKQVGSPQTFTYIVGTGIDDFVKHFGSMVVCITTDEDNLYDYSKGIMISGETFDNTKINNPERDFDWWYPRNYHGRGIEWERDAHIDFFETDGSLVLSTECGMRISGGTSRNAFIKSFKLIAREVYGNNSFNYEFFTDLTDHYGNKVDTFKKLVIRNSVNDDGGSMFRDDMLQHLGAYAGVDHQAGRPCVVFLNGKYYSLMTLKQSVDSDNLETRYKIPRDKLAMVTIQSTFFQFRYRTEAGPIEYFDEFFEDMNYLINTNFKNRDISEIGKIIDIDNFINYMSYQIFIVNPDWPHNNIVAWKYYDEPNSSIFAMDGKWRFVLNDLDFGLKDPQRDMFATVLSGSMYNNDPHLGRVLKSLLRNDEFNKRFKNHMIDLCNNILTEETITKYINDAWNARVKDMDLYRFYFGGNQMSTDALINEFKDFSRQRGKAILWQLNTYCP